MGSSWARPVTAFGRQSWGWTSRIRLGQEKVIGCNHWDMERCVEDNWKWSDVGETSLSNWDEAGYHGSHQVPKNIQNLLNVIKHYTWKNIWSWTISAWVLKIISTLQCAVLICSNTNLHAYCIYTHSKLSKISTVFETDIYGFWNWLILQCHRLENLSEDYAKRCFIGLRKICKVCAVVQIFHFLRWEWFAGPIRQLANASHCVSLS